MYFDLKGMKIEHIYCSINNEILGDLIVIKNKSICYFNHIEFNYSQFENNINEVKLQIVSKLNDGNLLNIMDTDYINIKIMVIPDFKLK